MTRYTIGKILLQRPSFGDLTSETIEREVSDHFIKAVELLDSLINTAPQSPRNKLYVLRKGEIYADLGKLYHCRLQKATSMSDAREKHITRLCFRYYGRATDAFESVLESAGLQCFRTMLDRVSLQMLLNDKLQSPNGRFKGHKLVMLMLLKFRPLFLYLRVIFDIAQNTAFADSCGKLEASAGHAADTESHGTHEKEPTTMCSDRDNANSAFKPDGLRKLESAGGNAASNDSVDVDERGYEGVCSTRSNKSGISSGTVNANKIGVESGNSSVGSATAKSEKGGVGSVTAKKDKSGVENAATRLDKSVITSVAADEDQKPEASMVDGAIATNSGEGIPSKEELEQYQKKTRDLAIAYVKDLQANAKDMLSLLRTNKKEISSDEATFAQHKELYRCTISIKLPDNVFHIPGCLENVVDTIETYGICEPE
jgi:phage tail protein X